VQRKNFAKTTHNGRDSGIADLNGTLWSIAPGFYFSGDGQMWYLNTSGSVIGMTADNFYNRANPDIFNSVSKDFVMSDTGLNLNGSLKTFTASDAKSVLFKTSSDYNNSNDAKYYFANMGIPKSTSVDST
jgi:hypothetical protein